MSGLMRMMRGVFCWASLELVGIFMRFNGWYGSVGIGVGRLHKNVFCITILTTNGMGVWKLQELLLRLKLI